MLKILPRKNLNHGPKSTYKANKNYGIYLRNGIAYN